MKDRPYDDVMIERFRKDPAYAAALLNSIFEDGDDQGELEVLLPLMVAAFSDSPPDSRAVQDINHLTAIFRAMGFRLSVTPSPSARREIAGSHA